MASSHAFTTPSGTQTHYLRLGAASGPLLVCLHGLGGSTATFEPLMPHLPQDTHAIALVDLQGFGKTPLKTPSSSEPLTIAGHLADLHALVAHLGGSEENPVILVGHSLGAILALHYTVLHPSSVSALALLGAGRSAAHIAPVRQRMLDLASATRAKGIGFAADLARTTNFAPDTESRAVAPEARQAYRDTVAGADPEGYARTCEMLVGDEHTDPDYGRITCPCVFVAGDVDAISPVERSRGLSELVGGESWVEVVRAGHQMLLEDAEAVGKAVGVLLDKVKK